MGSRFKSRWIILAPVSTIGLVLSCLLINDLNVQKEAGHRKPIGKLLRFDGKLRYKPQGAFSATEIQANHPLFNGDLIVTGLNSRAVIEMEDGRRLEIQPGTSVILDQEKDLKTPSVKGAVLLQGADGKEQYLTGGEMTNVTPLFFPCRLVAPEELSEVFIADERKSEIPFTWRFAGEKTSVSAVQISDNSLFQGEDVLAVPVSRAGIEQVGAKVPEGRHYWRLVDAEGKPMSHSRQFKVYKARPLTGTLPTGETLIWDGTTEFQWAVEPDNRVEFASHWIEISRGLDFNSLAQKKSISALTQHATISGLSEGNYYWRITSQYPSLTVSGAPRQFRLQMGRELILDAQDPKDRAILESPAQVLFIWGANAKNVQYSFELQSIQGALIEKTQSPVASQIVTNMAPGQYRWKVSGDLGSLHSESKWKIFSLLHPGGLELLSPRSGEGVVILSADSPIQFKWQNILAGGDDEYLFQLATDPQFKKIAGQKRTKEPKALSADFNLRPKQVYFWRVSVLSPSGLGLKLSPSSSFQYTIDAGLDAPQDLLPQNEATCNPLKMKSPCKFTWSSLPGALKYEFEIFKAMDFERAPSASNLNASKPVLRTTTKDNYYQIKILNEGNYYWTVRGIDQRKRLGMRSPPQKFHFSLGAPLSAPRTKSPEIQ